MTNNMKQLFFTLLLVLTGIVTNAQNLDFEGIPIDGPLKGFESRLTQKGFETADSYNDDAESKNEPIRYFFGKAWGHDCLLAVYYEPASRKVYRCMALLPFNYESVADQVIKDVMSKIKTKYGEYCSESVKKEPPYSVDYTIEGFDSEMDCNKVIGDIILTRKSFGNLPAVEILYSDMTSELTLFD